MKFEVLLSKKWKISQTDANNNPELFAVFPQILLSFSLVITKNDG